MCFNQEAVCIYLRLNTVDFYRNLLTLSCSLLYEKLSLLLVKPLQLSEANRTHTSTNLHPWI